MIAVMVRRVGGLLVTLLAVSFLIFAVMDMLPGDPAAVMLGTSASPDTLAWTKSGELMIMVILGGVGSFFGPIWGAAAFLILQTYLASWTEHWQLVLGILLLLIVLGTKGGLAGLFARLSGRTA